MKLSALTTLTAAGFAALTAANASAQVLINEFEPNPAGADPADATFELKGAAGTAFDLFILSIENDGFNGTVDRATNVTGSFDANGIGLATVPDLENPSFTVILTDAFTGAIGDDLDATDSGVLDTSTLGTILDAVGISDNIADDTILYASGLGGTDVLFNGQFEPLTTFRDGLSDALYQTVTVDFGTPEERIGIFGADGVEIDASLFSSDPLATTFGAVNPSLVPEPASLALLGLGGLAMAGRRRNRG